MGDGFAFPMRHFSLVETFKTRLKDHWTHYAKVSCYNSCETPQECRCRRKFYHVEEVKKWMRRSDSGDSVQSNEGTTNGARLLLEIHDKIKIYRPFPFPSNPHNILDGSDSSLLVFCILLQQDRGELIDIFREAGVYDSSLKHSTITANNTLKTSLSEKHVKNVNDILEQFERTKWEFLPQSLTLHMDKSFKGQNFIIPFCRRERVNDKGGTASVYHVVIKKEFLDDLKMREALSKSLYEDSEFGPCYQMALKSYSKDMETVYQWEKGAFSGLHPDGSTPIVRYLGCYSHDETIAGKSNTTFNLLLEYGQVDLEEYCADLGNVPPVRTEEIIRFWKSLFTIAQAINKVHNVSHTHGKRKMDYDGWHADIKPDNILSVHGQFKLADFGFARFSERESKGGAPMQIIEGGTDTYGAPEIARMRTDGTLTSVMQTIDTWSFGCVLSVAATWCVLGLQGIRQYRVLRQTASSNQKQTGPSTDRFHDGYSPLPEIDDWHEFLRKHIRSSDYATPLVLDLIETKMLRDKPWKRSTSKQLCDQLDDILIQANALAREKSTQTTSESVLRALLIIDESAEMIGTKTHSAKPVILPRQIQVDVTNEDGIAPSTLHMHLDSPGRASKRAGKGERLQSIPLAKTPHRRDILNEEMKGSRIFVSVQRNTQHSQDIDTHQGGYADSPIDEEPNKASPIRQRRPSRGDPNQRKPSPRPSANDRPTTRLRPDAAQYVAPTISAPMPRKPSKENETNESRDEVASSDRRVAFDPVVATQVVSGREPVSPAAASLSKHSESPNPLPPSPSSYASGTRSPHSASLPTSAPFTTYSRFDILYGGPSDMVADEPSELGPNTPYSGEEVRLKHDNLPHIPQEQVQYREERASKDRRNSYAGLPTPTDESKKPDPYSTAPPIREPPPSHVYDLDLDVCKVRQELERQKPRSVGKKLISKLSKQKKDEYLKDFIVNRDIILVVDNGSTIIPHWPIVQFVAQTLGMKLAGLDEDGIDVVFTINPDGNNRSGLRGLEGLEKLKNALFNARPKPPKNPRDRAPTDMSNTLERIFRSYLASHSYKKTTVIVLTDAAWEGTQPATQLDDVIVKFAQDIQKHQKRFEARHFTIGFIQFGEGAAEQQKLEKLDDELCKANQLHDIIDACTWKADVSKMLLGSFSSYHDDRENDTNEGQMSTPSFSKDSITYDPVRLAELFEDFNAGRIPAYVTSTTEHRPSPNPSSLDLPRARLNRSDTQSSNQSNRSGKRQSMLGGFLRNAKER